MNDEGSFFKFGIELKNSSVVLKKLLFRVDFASSQFFFKIFFHLCIFLRNPLVGLSGSPLIVLIGLGWALRLVDFLIKFTGIVITVVEVDNSSVESQRFTNSNVVGCEELSVFFGVFLSLQKFTLGDA